MNFAVHRIDITPDYPARMDGYGGRLDCNDGVHDPLTFTSLLLEENGRRLFLGAIDQVGLDREQARTLRRQIADITGTTPAAVMINCSHTHGGIMARQPMLESDDAANCLRNMSHIEEKILSSARAAAASLQPGTLFYGEGVTAIPMNRRLANPQGGVDNRPNPAGQTDSALKVLKVVDQQGTLAAVIARVSCHPVATGARHLLTADFPGAFRSAWEQIFPGSTAIFWQGVGADARPAHVAAGDRWRNMSHAELPLIGNQLLREVLQVLMHNMVRLDSLDFAAEERQVVLPMAHAGPVNIEAVAKAFETHGRNPYVERLRGMLERGEQLPTSLPLTVQMIRFSHDFCLAGIDAEVLSEVGAKMDALIASRYKMSMGYTNGAQVYLPDQTEYRRGGYEVSSHIIFALPYPLVPDMDRIVLEALADMQNTLLGS